MSLTGRGRNYTRLRELWENTQIKVFGGGWPGRIAYRLGLQRNVQVKEYGIKVKNFPKGAPPLRLAFATDFHAGPVTHPRLVKSAVKTIEQLRPDVVLLGGDFVFLETHYVDYLADELSRLSPPQGKFAVLGNHDLWADDRYISERLCRAGIKVLINQAVNLSFPYQGVSICGLDDWYTGYPDADAALNRSDGLKIVLMHTPSNLLDIQDKGYDVALCGHTHGGQVALPGGIPIIAGAGPLCRKYNYGRFAVGSGSEKTLIVSSGIGYGTVPIRLIAWSEVVLCHIHG